MRGAPFTTNDVSPRGGPADWCVLLIACFYDIYHLVAVSLYTFSVYTANKIIIQKYCIRNNWNAYTYNITGTKSRPVRRSGSGEAVRADLAMSRRDAQLTHDRRPRPPPRAAPEPRARSLPSRQSVWVDAPYVTISIYVYVFINSIHFRICDCGHIVEQARRRRRWLSNVESPSSVLE